MPKFEIELEAWHVRVLERWHIPQEHAGPSIEEKVAFLLDYLCLGQVSSEAGRAGRADQPSAVDDDTPF